MPGFSFSFFEAIFFSLCLAAVSSGSSHNLADSSGATIRLVPIHPGVNLEVVEWCNQGEPLIFLAGLGHTAHVFDEFAPRFCDKFRVTGITRRGFGASSIPEEGYDITTLAGDIEIVMDSLGIEKAILAGHSIGGDEMTKFVTLYPDRVRALIYLDAAYDRLMTRDSLANYPEPQSNTRQPSEDDLASLPAYREYYAEINGVMLPESEFLAICEWDKDGALADWITPGWVYKAAFDGLEHPDYSQLEVPALAIYAVEYPITELFINYANCDSLTQNQMRIRYDAGKRFDRLSRKIFRSAMKNGQVVELKGAGHSLYITHADQVELEMREFLSAITE